MGARPEYPCGPSLGECVQWIRSCEAAFGGAGGLFAVLEPDGTVAYAATSVERTLGRSPEALPGQPLTAFVHPDDRSALVETLSDVAGGRTRDRHVARLETADGDWRAHVLSVRPLTETFGVEGLAVSLRGADASALGALEAAPVGVTVSDGVGLDGPVTFANREVLSLTGSTAEDLLGESVAGLFAATPDVAALEASVSDEGAAATAELPLAGSVTEPRWCRVDVVPVRQASEERVTVVFYRDVTDARREHRALDALHETTRDLFGCDSKADVAVRTLESVEEVVSLPVGVFLQYDPAKEQLRPVALSEAATTLLETVAPVPVAEGLLGEVFATGWGRYLTGVADEAAFELGGPLDGALLLPVGKHGLLLVGCPAGELDLQQRDLARVLADVMELALDRVDQRDFLDGRERELGRQRAELAALGRTNGTIRGVIRALVNVGNREGIERAVCQQLADLETVVFAWFGPSDAPQDRILPSSWAGVSATYVDRFVAGYETHPIHGLAGEAARTGRVTVVDSVHDAPGWDAVRPEALRNGFQSVAAIPVGHRGTVAGVLVVADSRPAAFDERLRAVYAELGDVVGAAMFSAQQDDAGVSHTVIVRLAVADDGCLANRLSEQLECELDLEGVTSFGNGKRVVFLTVTGSSEDAVTAFLGEQEAVESVRSLVAEGEHALFEVALASLPLFDVVTERGGRIESCETCDGTSDVTIELPAGADVRAVVETVQTIWSDTSFHSRQERPRPVETPTTFLARLQEELTDRQLQALQTAYYGGFYEWPRTSRNDQLASVMDITSATFQYHRRVAERKLLELLFD